MSKIRLQFEVAKGSEMAPTAALLQQKLGELPEVEKAKASPDEARIGLMEAAAIISGVVILTRSTGELVDEARKLIPKIRAFIAEMRGVTNVYVEVGARRVPIDQLSDADIEKMVE